MESKEWALKVSYTHCGIKKKKKNFKVVLIPSYRCLAPAVTTWIDQISFVNCRATLFPREARDQQAN